MEYSNGILKICILKVFFKTYIYFSHDSVMKQVLGRLQCNDLYTPICTLMNERRKSAPRKHHHSIYREILFLSFIAIGRENIDNCEYISVLKMFWKILCEYIYISLYIYIMYRLQLHHLFKIVAFNNILHALKLAEEKFSSSFILAAKGN